MSNQIEMEQQILGCILTDLNAAYICMDEITPDDFSSDKARGLYEILLAAAVDLKKTNGSDILTYVSQYLPQNPVNYDMAEVAHICSMVPSSSNLPYYIGQLKNYSNGRKLLKTLETVHGELQAPVFDFEEIAGKLENEILKIGDRDKKEISFRDALHHVFDNLGNQKGIAGYTWGLSDLDRITGGIELGKAYVIGGLKKSGKTKLALNTTMCLWEKGIKSGWISLEMGRFYLVRWILSHVAQVDAHSLKVGKIRQADWSKLTMAAGKLDNGEEILIDDRAGLTIPQVRSTIRRFSQKGAQVIFLDFLQRLKITTGRGENRATAIQDATRELADMAKDYNVGLVYLSQLNNSAEGRIATIADLKESGGIGENVECAIVINNMDRINKRKDEKTNIAKFVIEQRDGESDMVEFVMQLQYSKFLDKATGNNGTYIPETEEKIQDSVPF